MRLIERGLLALGLLLLTVSSAAYIHRFIMFRAEMTRFEARQLEYAREQQKENESAGSERRIGSHERPGITDHSFWSPERARLHQVNLSKSGEALAVLRIPRLHMEVPVLEGTDSFTLNRGIGRIPGTARPGQDGNIGIAGHRDGFFRPLKDIRAGDSIELVTTSGTNVYAVDRVRITTPADVSVLRSGTKPSLTLVTCYPFYLVGPAPGRYVVEASLAQQANQEKEYIEDHFPLARREQ